MTVPRVVLLTGDLMFGSRVEKQVRSVGADVLITADRQTAIAEAGDAALLVVDLVDGEFIDIDIGEISDTPTLGFYAHTDDDVRQGALAAGFDKVVPRSRMARDGHELIAQMIA